MMRRILVLTSGSSLCMSVNCPSQYKSIEKRHVPKLRLVTACTSLCNSRALAYV